MTKKNVRNQHTSFPLKKRNKHQKNTKKKRNNDKERTKKHVCYLMPLLHISRMPGPLPPRMHPLHIHASPTLSRVERITREGMGRVGTPPRVFEQKTWAKQKRREGKVQTWHKVVFQVGNNGKTEKKNHRKLEIIRKRKWGHGNHAGKGEFWGVRKPTSWCIKERSSKYTNKIMMKHDITINMI